MDLTLTADTSRTTGSRAAGRLRAGGQVPGVVYGLGREAVAVSVPWMELRRALTTEAGLNALITLEIDGRRDLTIVKELQRDPVRRDVLHVDFLRIDRDAEVEVDVPIVLLGEAKEVEQAKGIVEHHLSALTIKALPADIPNELSIDITDLTVGTSITVAEVDLPAGVSTDVDVATPVVSGVATRFSEAEEVEEGAEGEAEEGEAAEGSDASTSGEGGE